MQRPVYQIVHRAHVADADSWIDVVDDASNCICQPTRIGFGPQRKCLNHAAWLLKVRDIDRRARRFTQRQMLKVLYHPHDLVFLSGLRTELNVTAQRVGLAKVTPTPAGTRPTRRNQEASPFWSRCPQKP